MEKTIEILVQKGNKIVPYNTYAVKTKDGDLHIGYFSESKKSFRTNDWKDVKLADIIACADIEILQNTLNEIVK